MISWWSKTVCKVYLNTAFPYTISTFGKGRKMRGIKKREEHKEMKNRGRTGK